MEQNQFDLGDPVRALSPTSTASTEPITTGLTSSQVDFLANLSAWPGTGEARRMTVRSGRRCSALLRKQDPLSSLAKTLLESSTWNSTRCWLTWRESATPQGRLLFLLAPSMPRTEGSESSSSDGMWPTVDVRGFDNEGQLTQLKEMAESREEWERMAYRVGVSEKQRIWPTPTEDSITERRGNYAQGGTPLTAAVKMWATPNAMDGLPAMEEKKRMNHPSRLGRSRSGNLREQVIYEEPQPPPMWATPTKEGFDAQGHRGTKDTLDSQAKMWPTPTKGDGHASGSRNTPESNAHAGLRLTDAVRDDGGTGRLWPTPNAHDGTGARGKGYEKTDRHHKPHDLVSATQMWPSPRTASKSNWHGANMGAVQT